MLQIDTYIARLILSFLGYTDGYDYVYTKSPGYGAETWRLFVVNEENSQGLREVHFKNDHSSFFISYDGTSLKGVSNENTDTLFYYEEV